MCNNNFTAFGSEQSIDPNVGILYTLESPEDKSPKVETPVAQEGSGEAKDERGSEPAPEEMEVFGASCGP